MRVKLKGLNINYQQYGSGQQAVILLHGWGQNISMMAPIGEHLASDFVVYNLDFPSFGNSDQLNEVWGVGEFSEMLAEFVAYFNIDKPIIIAHSFGVRVAIVYANHYPVHKLVFTGGAGILPKRNISYYFKVYTYKLTKTFLNVFGLKKLRKQLESKAGSEDYRALSGVMRASFSKIVNLDLRPYLKNIKAETLLVWGEHDDATPLWMGKVMEEEIPNAGLAIFENDGHYAYFNQMERFLRVVDIFLKEDKK